MEPSKLNVALLSDSVIFEAIHDAKGQFKALFTDISNGLENSKLTGLYPKSKGVKISMGNELQKCPYQVLDIFRDFDKKTGHNVRILNWWGHGLYIFIFFGKESAAHSLEEQEYFKKLGYHLAKGNSPWDYSGILNLPKNQNSKEDDNINRHLAKFGYLQWFKKLPLEEDIFKLRSTLSDQLDQIFHFHRI